MSNLKVLTRRIDVDNTFSLQRQQKYEILPMSGTVPASSNSIIKASVSNQGHFYALFMTGSFTTLVAGPADDGVNHLRGKLFSNNDPLFNQYVPFDLFLSPGRRKAAVVPGAAAGNNLFLQFPIEFLFPANTDIIMDTINDGDYANAFDIAFVGIRCSAYGVVEGVKKTSAPAIPYNPSRSFGRRGR